ncbi:MAG: amidohydrolase [Alphaproteobacteria bacterium]|nr:amidohydrolase [Alphaproteobacteria bacterium]
MNKLFALPLLLAAAAPAPQPPAPQPPPSQDAGFVAFPGQDLFFDHVELVDGTGAAARRGVSVLVRGGRIAAIGDLTAPPGVTLIDGRGKTLLPGFVMVHEHMFYPSPKGGEYEEYPYSFSRLYLAGGTTTMRTGGSLAPSTSTPPARSRKARSRGRTSTPPAPISKVRACSPPRWCG